MVSGKQAVNRVNKVTFVFLTLAIFINYGHSFSLLNHGFKSPDLTSNHQYSPTALQMGIFDSIKNAFNNEEYAAPPEGVKATARHILVKNEKEINEILEKISEGSSSFANLASQYSTCPSGAMGGSLGSFSPGTMVREFDDAIFNPKTNIGEIVGPVQTKFGYHLIVVDKRTGI